MSFITGLVFRDPPSMGAPKGTYRQTALALLGAGRGRGQDDSGAWACDQAALAVRMHRVRDLTPDGAQPFPSMNGQICVALDGYIANAHALRRELENAGIRLRGHSDGELIAEGTALWGLNRLLQKMDGAFACILWDEQANAMHLVRDRLGARPLYVFKSRGGFAVASDNTAFRALPEFKAAPDIDAIKTWLGWGCVPAPQTLLNDVVCIPPGHRLMLRPTDDALPATEPYWSPANTLEEIALREGQKNLHKGEQTDLITQASAMDVPFALIDYPPAQAANLRAILYQTCEASFSSLSLASPDGPSVQTAFDALAQLAEPAADPRALGLWLTLRRTAADTPVCMIGCGLSNDPLEFETHPRLRRFLATLPRVFRRFIPARFMHLVRDAHRDHAQKNRIWDLGVPCADTILPRLELSYDAQSAFYDFTLGFCGRDLAALDRTAASANVSLRMPQADARLLAHGLPVWPDADYGDIAVWMRGPLRPRIAEVLTPAVFAGIGIEDPAPFLKKWQEFLGGDNAQIREIWALAVFCAWAAKRFNLG